MTTLKDLFIEKEYENHLAEDVEAELEQLKSLQKELTAADLQKQVDALQERVKKLKREGISVWNAKEKIPVVFDTVDGAFVVMAELINKIDEIEKKLEEKK
jgi:hypothetical protein